MLQLLGWYQRLSQRGKLIAALVIGLVALALVVLAFFFFGKVGQAIAYLFGAGGAGLSGNEVKKLIQESEQSETRKDNLRKEADKKQAESLQRQKTQVIQFDRQMHKRNEAADNAALSGDDKKLIQQAEQNADKIMGYADTGEIPTVPPGKNTIHSLLPFLLPFLMFLSGCASAGAAGSVSPGVSQMVQIPRSKLLKIVKSQNVCLRNLRAAKALHKGELERQSIKYESLLDQCKEDKNRLKRETIRLKHQKNTNWVPWIVFGGYVVLSGGLIVYLSLKAFPVANR